MHAIEHGTDSSERIEREMNTAERLRIFAAFLASGGARRRARLSSSDVGGRIAFDVDFAHASCRDCPGIDSA